MNMQYHHPCSNFKSMSPPLKEKLHQLSWSQLQFRIFMRNNNYYYIQRPEDSLPIYTETFDCLGCSSRGGAPGLLDCNTHYTPYGKARRCPALPGVPAGQSPDLARVKQVIQSVPGMLSFPDSGKVQVESPLRHLESSVHGSCDPQPALSCILL